jgi:hypothetical protein
MAEAREKILQELGQHTLDRIDELGEELVG